MRYPSTENISGAPGPLTFSPAIPSRALSAWARYRARSRLSPLLPRHGPRFGPPLSSLTDSPIPSSLRERIIGAPLSKYKAPKLAPACEQLQPMPSYANLRSTSSLLERLEPTFDQTRNFLRKPRESIVSFSSSTASTSARLSSLLTILSRGDGVSVMVMALPPTPSEGIPTPRLP